MKHTLAITVAAIIEADGQFLCVEERAHERLVINQPAGHLEPGESLVDGAVREVQEETGWRFAPQGVVGIYRWTHARENKTYVRACFFGTGHDHNPAQPLDKGIERALWLSRDALSLRKSNLRSPLVLRCVDDYLAGKRYPLDLVVDVS